MKYAVLLVLALLVHVTVDSRAQDNRVGTIAFEDVEVSESGGSLNIGLVINIDELELSKQDLLIITPVLQENNGPGRVALEPVAVAGRVRLKAVERAFKLGNEIYDDLPSYVHPRRNGGNQSIPFGASVDFEPWMRDAGLTFMQSVTGCRNCPPCYAEYRVSYRLPEPAVEKVTVPPRYEVAFAVPEPEPVKRRSENYSAVLSFGVGKHELRRDFGNNDAVLSEADRIIGEITKDPDLTVEMLSVTGYASPEGNYNQNMSLSQHRAYAFVEYLSSRHEIQPYMVSVDWKGEDWDGLRSAVEASDMPAKYDIIGTIDSNPDVELRKRKLRALGGGSVYRELLKDYYPALRRNEYSVAFVARGFDLEEAKVMVKTKPQYLSLNEMFHVANSYAEGSAEFREVFDIAVRMFPDDETARVNCAAQEIDAGMYEQAMKRISGLTTPEALNNMGVIYARQGAVAQAERYFTLAAGAGLEKGFANLEQLRNHGTER